MPATLLADVFTQQFVCLGIQDSNAQMIPLQLDESPDPSWRYAVESRFNFDAAIQVNHAFAVLVITEGFKRQRLKAWLLFGKHCGDLPLCRAVYARVGPSGLPVIQIGLRLF